MSEAGQNKRTPIRKRTILVLLALTCVLGCALAWPLWEPNVRGLARRIIETQLDDLLTGSVEIDRVDALNFGSVTATGVRIVDAEGREVLKAARLELDFNLYELAQSRLRFTRGALVDAEIRAIPSEQVAITLFDALIPKPSDDTSPSSFEVFFNNLHISNATLHGDVPGLSGLSAAGLEIRGDIEVQGGFRAKISKIAGKLDGPFSLPVEVAHATTEVRTDPLRISSAARLSVNDDQLHASLHYEIPDAGADQLKLVVKLAPASSDLLQALDLAIAGSIISKLEGTVRLEGPLDALVYDASLHTDGGPLSVRGKLPSDGDLTVHVETKGLALDQLLAYFPPVELAVRVDATAPSEGPIAIRAEAPWINVLGVRVDNIDLAGRYESGRFDIDSLLAFYAGGRFRGAGFVDENLDGKLHIRSEVPDVGRVARLKRVHAAISTDAVLEKQGEKLSFDGTLGLEQFAFEGATFRALQLKGSVVAEEDLLKPKVNLKATAAAVAYAGYVADRFDFSVRGNHGRYAADISLKDAVGRFLNGHVDIVQRGDGVELRAHPFELSVGGREPWRAQADLVLDGSGVEFRELILANGAQRLSLNGKYSFSRAYRLQGSVESFDLGGLRELSGADLADLDGILDGTLTLSGVPQQPRIDAHGLLQQGVFLGMTGLTVSLDLVFVDDRFDIDSLVILDDGSRLNIYAGGVPGNGRGFSEQVMGGNYQFGLDFDRVPFSVSQPWLSWVGLEAPPGTVSATIRGAGSVADPIVDIKTQVRNIELFGFPPMHFDLSVAHDGQLLDLREFTLADQKGPIATLSGRLASLPHELTDLEALRASLATRDFRAELQVEERRLDELPKEFGLNIAVIAGGRLEVAQSPNGPIAQLDGVARWPDREAGLGACTMVRRPSLVLQASATAQEVRGQTQASLDREAVAKATFRAAVPLVDWLTGSAPFSLPEADLELQANTQTAEEIPGLCEYVAGPLRMELSAKDIFGRPPKLTFTAKSAALQLVPHATQSSRLGNLRSARAIGRPFAVDLSGSLGSEQIDLKAILDLGKGSRAEIQGVIPRANLLEATRPTARPIEADLKFTRFEVAPVLIAFPISARVSGTIDGGTHVTYKLAQDQLSFDGALSFSNGHVGVSTLGQEFDEVEAQLKLKGNWIRIEEIKAHDFDGQFRAEGNVVFQTARQIRTDFALRLQDFPIRQEGALVSALTGRLAFRAEIDANRTRSELQVIDLLVNIPNALASSLQSLDPHPSVFIVGQAPPAPDENPYLFELRFLAEDTPFRVLRTGLSAEVFADLTVSYQDPNLTVQGSAELKRGDVDLYGKRFELRESRMAFDANSELDPIVNLYAVHKVGGDEIGVRVDGRLSDPQVSFSHSDPSVTDTGEIIARLLGTRTDDFARQNSDATGAAAGILAGATAGLLTEEVRKNFGGAVPVLSVESRTQSMKSTRIRAGVQLDQLIEKRLGALRHVVRGAYIEGFVAPGADPRAVNPNMPPQSRGGGLLELRFPADMVGTVEYRPVQNWRLDVAWEP